MNRARRAGALLLTALVGCAQSEVDTLVDQLNGPKRAEAIDRLVSAVSDTPAAQRAEKRQRTIDALGIAYRDDRNRPKIVAALALLGDPRANPIFVAALGEAGRDGPYLAAATRAANALNEAGARAALPALLKQLDESIQMPKTARRLQFQKALVAAIGRSGSETAEAPLRSIISKAATEQSLPLVLVAIDALGRLHVPTATPLLVPLLGERPWGQQTAPAARRALCSIGPSRTDLEQLQNSLSRPNALVQLIALHADLGYPPPALSATAELSWPLFEAQLRSPTSHSGALETLVRMLDRPNLGRDELRRASSLLGLYGSPAQAPLLYRLLGAQKQLDRATHALALAYSRLGKRRLSPELRRRLKQHYGNQLSAFEQRLAAVSRCKGARACNEMLLGKSDKLGAWRVAERAAISLGHSGIYAPLAGALATAHRQVRRTIITLLERAPLKVLPPLAPAIEHALQSAGAGFDSDTATRAHCLLERVRRTTGKRGQG
ncbi:MAG: hypothetical protein H6707_14020 [Deltaproteobacteria bacterium]|nr:hypothetical protein [Deltaproteobacteria bacterium]